MVSVHAFNILNLLQIPKYGNKAVSLLYSRFLNEEFSNTRMPEQPHYLEYWGFIKSEIIRSNPVFANLDWDQMQLNSLKIISQSNLAGINIISFFDSNYPIKLRRLKNPPLILNYIGRLEKLNSFSSAAVIGTRQPTEFGYKVGIRIGEILGLNGFAVVSGLAKGCDTAAHYGCLISKGFTVGILAHGLEKIYPKENRLLAKQILDTDGLLISEYVYGHPARPSNFVERDRIQAGLSDFLVVVETGIIGGTMHTIKSAIELGTKVYAYNHPERFFLEDKVQGNQLLIKNGDAIPLTDSKDFESMIKAFKISDPTKINIPEGGDPQMKLF